jgi:hypothetical protein
MVGLGRHQYARDPCSAMHVSPHFNSPNQDGRLLSDADQKRVVVRECSFGFIVPRAIVSRRTVVLEDIYLVLEQDQERSRTDVRLGANWLQNRGKCRDVRQWPTERRRGAACAIIFHFLKIL